MTDHNGYPNSADNGAGGDRDIDDLKRKYLARINGEEHARSGRGGNTSTNGGDESGGDGGYDDNDPDIGTRQYKDFKEQYMPKTLTWYERWCGTSARLLNVSPDPAQRPKLEEAIRICHLETTPEGITSFSVLAPVVFILSVVFIGFLLPIIIAAANGSEDPAAAGSTFILLFGVVAGASMIIPLQRLPFYLANNWRMKASNQMVLCTFYIVTYMRHTSNLELAIDFAGEHLAPPLSMDMKKVLWDIETERYDSIHDSLDGYLETWKEWNPEFIESMHLIQGSLLETAESRRVDMLDKSLTVMLDETYEKMLHYAHNLKSPLTTLHMLGVILPILGLVILPLMVNFIPEVQWYHMAIVYNVTLPVLVYLIAKSILSTRPSGYGSADITELNPELRKLKYINIPLGGKDSIQLSPAMLAVTVCIALLIAGFFPFAYHLANPNSDWVITSGSLREVDTGYPEEYQDAKFYFLDYRPEDAKDPGSPRTSGPFGIGAVLLSLLVPLAFGVALGMHYIMRSRGVMQVREETRKLEQEFASALFQLGNRLADGIPAEVAFPRVAEVLQGTATGRFFDIVTTNITKLGMSVEQAIFDERRGAIREYPSSIIESSMKVLVESNKKGPLVASQALINVSEYIKQMHRVDERLRDLMSDVISSMKSQISFLTPVIAGIVIGITSMISNILGTIAGKMGILSEEVGTAGTGAATSIPEIIGSGSIPIFHFQVIVGLYVVQISYILTIMVNGIENGVDVVAEEDALGKNMLRATLLYVVVSAITIILFSFISGNISGMS